MRNGSRMILKIGAAAVSATIAIGGWCFALGQRTSDKALKDRVDKIELNQAKWDGRWDERWDRILQELKTITARLDKIQDAR
jgi:hypothetical protein